MSELTLSRNLHSLVARLDRAADSFLRTEPGLSYSRFLALYMVSREGTETQRALAARLGVSEPSVSRMVRVLADHGWLESTPTPGDGNRNQLRLTASGERLVNRWGSALEERLAELLDAAGVSYRSYAASTRRLLTQIDAGARA